MRATNLLFCAGLALVAACSIGPARGGETGSATNSWTMRTCHEEGPGLLPCDRAYVRAGTNSFAFLIPPEMQLQTWNGSVAMVNRDYSRQIIVRILEPGVPDPGEITSDTASQWLGSNHPQARVLNTFSLAADSRRGPAFEIAFVGPANSPRRGVVAFVPSRIGVLEFSLTTSPEQFAAARQQLNTLMLTFRLSDQKGELHISPLSDKL